MDRQDTLYICPLSGFLHVAGGGHIPSQSHLQQLFLYHPTVTLSMKPGICACRYEGVFKPFSGSIIPHTHHIL